MGRSSSLNTCGCFKHHCHLNVCSLALLHITGVMQGLLTTDFNSIHLSRLVGCCPALQHLQIQLQPDVQLAALSQLTALTSLTVRRATESTISALSGLLALQHVNVQFSSPCSRAVFLPLTALKQLTYLVALPLESPGGAALCFRREVSVGCKPLGVMFYTCPCNTQGVSERQQLHGRFPELGMQPMTVV